MIVEPLADRWRYDLGDRKIQELRASLGLSSDGPAPVGSVFAYAVVPGLARMLTHPAVSSTRKDLRMSRLEVVLSSELDMRGELACTCDVEAAESITGTVAAVDHRGARAVSTLHLTPDESYVATPPLEDPHHVADITTDPARCMAFAAATWDLNPAYWDREFAEAAELGGLVAPPGLPVALAIEALRAEGLGTLSALDVSFERAARPGDRLQLSVAPSSLGLDLQALSEDGIVVSGRVVLRDGGEVSVTS